MARPKPTKYERVKIDFVIEFKDPHDSVRFGGHEDFAAFQKAIFDTLKSLAEAKGIEGLGATSMNFGLDNRPRNEDGTLKGKR